jgi:hypothetical protein
MFQRSVALTAALPGQLTFILIISAILALIASYLFLRLYRRAVVVSMQRRTRSDVAEIRGYLPPEPEHKPHDAPLSFNFITRAAMDLSKNGKRLYRTVLWRRWRSGVIYAIAGACFAATMTAAIFSAQKMDFAPFRFLYLTWVNYWPVVLAVDLAVGLSRRGRLIGAAVYFLAGVIAGSMLLIKGPAMSTGELFNLWLQSNVPATILLLIFMNRRLRAVGPLMLIFMIFFVSGANLFVATIRNQPKLLRAVGEFGVSIGLSAPASLVALQVIGFAAFAIAGWLGLGALSKFYRAKRISEQSVTIDSIWLLFGTVNAIGLVGRGPLWIFSGVVALAIYKLVAAGLFRVLTKPRRPGAGRRRLLLLRVSSLGASRESFYDRLGKSWRTVGSIQLIAGSESATSAIQPYEFWDYVGGNLARRFIDSGRTLDLRIDHMDLAPDKDGQFRVTEFFCHDDTWKITLARLADDSDVVLMDLRGFTPANSARLFESDELFNVVALSRIVFAVDDTTDQPFMRQTMQRAWIETKDRSPNRRLPAGKVALVDLSGMSAASLHNLLFGLCAAATAGSK